MTSLISKINDSENKARSIAQNFSKVAEAMMKIEKQGSFARFVSYLDWTIYSQEAIINNSSLVLSHGGQGAHGGADQDLNLVYDVPESSGHSPFDVDKAHAYYLAMVLIN